MIDNLHSIIDRGCFLAINKEAGLTSFDVVRVVRKLFNIKKVGHTGTLDPLACGVLIVALGRATKFIEYVVNSSKTYIFKVKLGISTETDDAEGKIIATSSHIPSIDEINNILPEFIGNIEQQPPVYSAVKVNGVKAYKLARKNKEFKLQKRKVTVKELQVLDYQDGIASFIMKCEKGTYVRSIARDMALRLKSVGHVVYLERYKLAKIEKKQAIVLASLQDMLYNEASLINKYLFPIEYFLDDISDFILSELSIRDLKLGKQVKVEQDCVNGLYKALDRDNKNFKGLISVDGGVVSGVKML